MVPFVSLSYEQSAFGFQLSAFSSSTPSSWILLEGVDHVLHA